jgi:kynurenine formamidase
MSGNGLPSYAELPRSQAAPQWRTAWGVFQDAAELGTLGLLTPERRLAAMQLVRDGRTVNLDHPMDVPLAVFAHRKPFRHHVFEIMPGYYDETLDNLAPQLSSQWDAVRHVRSPDGFFDGLREDKEALTSGGSLGIDHAAVAGIVGRGVLLDVERHLRHTPEAVAPDERREIPPNLLDEVAAAQGVELREGDVLLVRFGVDSLIRAISQGDASRDMTYAAPGLQQDDETVAWLWDKHVAAVCADNIAVEVTPPRGPNTRIHPALLGLLGLAMGELFDLSELSEACAERGQHEFLFAAKPWRLPGGLGSPANAMAIL